MNKKTEGWSLEAGEEIKKCKLRMMHEQRHRQLLGIYYGKRGKAANHYCVSFHCAIKDHSITMSLSWTFAAAQQFSYLFPDDSLQ
jgi:hypothetical protein